MKSIKKVLSVGMLTAIGLLSGQKTYAQNQATYENPDFKKKQTTPYHCKLIENNTKLVVNYKDTFTVFDIRKDSNQIICDLGPSMQNFVYNPTYYIDTPWISSSSPYDYMTSIAMFRDYKLSNLYYEYENMGDYQKRDSVELLLLENRKRALERFQQKQK